MRIDKLWIKEFKNLKDFEIDFDEEQMTTVLIGHNGTGKSNLIEALVIIFRDLDLGKPPSFSYDLTYVCRKNKIRVIADSQKKTNHTKITVDEKLISFSKFTKRSDRMYFPKHIFAYYSGPSNRLESHFDIHQKRFYDELLNDVDKPLRPLFYARNIHSQFVLLSYFSFDESGNSREFLDEYLNISGLESVLFILKQPPWKSHEGDERFWYARGVVQKFLSEVYKYSQAPLRKKERISIDFTRSQTRELLYLYIPNEKNLRQIARKYGNNREFFKVLESTYISDLVHEVQIKVKKTNGDLLTFKELSEGEQQLLTVLGLMKFTKEEESLFLLDEPDTHLNPAWKLDYLNLLEDVVGEQKTSHFIICTHDPLLIGGLLRSQVQIFEKDLETGKISTSPPDHDPRGMGVAALLTSDLFGLSTTLDLETQRKLDRKRELYLKSLDTEPREEENEEMRRLADELGTLDFTRTIRDPLYNKFVKAMMSRDEFKKPILTPKERKVQEKIARQIIDEILAEEKQ